MILFLALCPIPSTLGDDPVDVAADLAEANIVEFTLIYFKDINSTVCIRKIDLFIATGLGYRNAMHFSTNQAYLTLVAEQVHVVLDFEIVVEGQLQGHFLLLAEVGEGDRGKLFIQVKATINLLIWVVNHVPRPKKHVGRHA